MFVLRTVFVRHLRGFCSAADSRLKEATTQQLLNFNEIKHQTKVPLQPHNSTVQSTEAAPKFEIDKESLELLEKFALVNIRDR